MNVFEGKVVSEGMKVGIVAARFNEFIVSKLVAGAQDALVRHDVKEEDIDLAWVPRQQTAHPFSFRLQTDVLLTSYRCRNAFPVQRGTHPVL